MAGRLGYAANSQVWGEINPNLSSDLNAFGQTLFDPAPFEIASRIGQGGYSSYRLPGANRWPIAGSMQPAFMQDFYFRIHVVPAVLDVGNVVSEQVHDVVIWNAYLTSNTLEDLSGENTEGVILSGQPNPPFAFAPLAELVWKVAVTPDGPPTVEAVFTWQFTGEPPVQMAVVGNRITAWTFSPDWSDGVTELLSWLTDILPSEIGVEQRRGLRDLPRRAFEFPILASGRDRALLDLALFGWGARIWALPIWHDVQWLPGVVQGSTEVLCETAHRDFSDGGLALLLGDGAAEYEVLEVLTVESDRLQLRSAVASDWPTTVRLYPVRSARLTDQPRMRRVSDNTVRAGISFQVEDYTGWDHTYTLPDYRGWPVLEMRPAETGDLTLSYTRLLQVLDNDISAPYVEDTADLGFTVQAHRWLMEGAEERSQFRGYCYTQSGRQKAVWLPSWMDDLTLAAPFAAGGTSLDVEHVQYGRFAGAKMGRRDLRIELRDGSIWYRRVTGSLELDSETERLGLETFIDQAFDPADVWRISWMALMRLDSDQVEIKHTTDIDGAASAQLLYRGVRDDDI